MENLLSFGDLLKTFRQRQHLTQQELAEQLGVHRNTIGIWERGDYLPESKTLVLELAHQLGLVEPETRQLLEASLTALSPYWSVPLPRNLYFTGRAAILETLHTQLSVERALALTQSSALHGLGGVGKTQLALEYAYRYALEYSAIFWLGAETQEELLAGLVRVASVLQLPERDDRDQQRAVEAVQRWLSTHDQWLLILDNVEKLDMLDRWLPAVRRGAMLITTRNSVLGTFARGIDLLPMQQEEGMLFLLLRAKVLSPQASSEDLPRLASSLPKQYRAAEELVAALDGLPLALDQAGAYCEETGCSLSDYLRHYEHHQARLLSHRGSFDRDHPHSVGTTFRLVIEQVEREQQAAADVLRICALVQAEAIPEELFVEGATALGPHLAEFATDSSRFDQAMVVLRNFSLLQRSPETHTLSIHRLVQAVVSDWMSEQERVVWLKRLIVALNALFPENAAEAQAWEQCERLLLHVLAMAAALPASVRSLDLVEVLRKTADYLHERAQYERAEQVYRQAIHIGEQHLAPNHLALAPALAGLAFLCGRQGKYEQAETLGSRALSLSKQALGPAHPQVAASLTTLAILYSDQSKYAQAEPLFARSISIWEQALGQDHPQVAVPLNRLALLYWKQGNYAQAEPFFQRALSIWQQAYGPGSLHMAQPLYDLALLYWKQGQYKQADPLFERALAIWQHAYGPEHPSSWRNVASQLLACRSIPDNKSIAAVAVAIGKCDLPISS